MTRGERTIDMHRHFTERESSLANYHTRRQSSMGPEIGEEPSAGTAETVLHIARLARTTKSYDTECWREGVEIKPLHHWCGRVTYCGSSGEPSGSSCWSLCDAVTQHPGRGSRRHCPKGETANFSLRAVSLTGIENSVSAANLRGYSWECFRGSFRVQIEAYGKSTWNVHLLE